jgi:hypothetical protein
VGLELLKTLIGFIMNEDLRQVTFEYAKNVRPDKERERFLKNQARLWFEPFVEEINSQTGTINFFLKEGVENRVHLNRMSKDLGVKLYERLRMFQIPQPL